MAYGTSTSRRSFFKALPFFGVAAVATTATVANADDIELDTLVRDLQEADAAYFTAHSAFKKAMWVVDAAAPVGVIKDPSMAGFYRRAPREFNTIDENELRAAYARHIETCCFGNAEIWVRQRMEEQVADLRQQLAHHEQVKRDTNFEALAEENDKTASAYDWAFHNLARYVPKTLEQAIKKAGALDADQALEVMTGIAA